MDTCEEGQKTRGAIGGEMPNAAGAGKMGGHLHLREDVVLRLRLARHLDLLQTHRQRVGGNVDTRDHKVEARRHDAIEAAAALHNLRTIKAR